VLALRDIGKTYQTGRLAVPVLRSVSLRIERGELCAITGASGSGKSTLLNMLGLLDRPDSGEFEFDGIDVVRAAADERARLRNQKVGFVFQSFHLLARLTALDNVALPFLYRGIPAKRSRPLSLRALERVGLADRAHHRPQELSGGQQQRVAIARAIVTGPSLILADEPTGNLDTAAANDIINLLLEINRETSATVIVVTHDPSIAARCRRRIVVRDGSIIDSDRAARPLEPVP
jgi:putative ABC transport system ATP-binding protein